MKLEVYFVRDQNIVESNFLSYVQSYYDLLRGVLVNTAYEYEYEHLDFRSRIKQKDSILNKLLYYKDEKNEQGKVPINKCLNDLLGSE